MQKCENEHFWRGKDFFEHPACHKNCNAYRWLHTKIILKLNYSHLLPGHQYMGKKWTSWPRFLSKIHVKLLFDSIGRKDN